ncbi:MAG: hypothetical protein GTN74_14055 [Proteobacteria bacterium]|nr:hypothetical protein [Pseudomonadota bacterium]NIS71654.1 hypothetical protein [Pseudomonadota bacterium]
MRSEVDQLLEDLEYIRSNAGSIGPDHPKVKKWVGEVRSYLNREKNTKGLKKFEQMDFVKGGTEMWSQNTISRGSIRNYKADLDRIEGILEKMEGSSSDSSPDEKIKELLFASSEEPTPEEIPVDAQIDSLVEDAPVETRKEEEKKAIKEPLRLESTMDQNVEPNFEAIKKQHLSASARDEAVDKLMDDLKAEMKSSEPDWGKIQNVMADMMGLKKTGEILERLKANVNTPGVSWETVREIMSELWAIKKDMVIDLLPTILKT